MLFNVVEFPEFIENNDQVYILDSNSKDDKELEERGKELQNRNSMDVSDFKIKLKEGKYGLYVR